MLRLLLERDGEILCEVPLSRSDWLSDELDDELNLFRRRMQVLFRTYSAMLNENRVRMLRTLLQDEDSTLSFKEFMDALKMNPKVVRENALKLSEAGFIESPSRGKYQLSTLGSMLFIVAGPALLRILDTLREEVDEE